MWQEYKSLYIGLLQLQLLVALPLLSFLVLLPMAVVPFTVAKTAV